MKNLSSRFHLPSPVSLLCALAFFLVACSLGPVTVCAGQGMGPGPGVKAYSGGGGGLTWTNNLFFLTAEANDLDGTYNMGADDHSAGDTSGTYDNEVFIISNTGPLVGSYSFNYTNTSGTIGWDVSSNNIFPASVGSIGLWVRYSTMPSGNGYLVYVRSADWDSLMRVTVSSTGEITAYFFDGGNNRTFTTTNAALTTNTNYFIEILYNGTAGTVQFYLNNTLLTATDDDTFSAMSGAVEVIFGDMNNEAGAVRTDNYMIFNTNMRLWDYRSAAYDN